MPQSLMTAAAAAGLAQAAMRRAQVATAEIRALTDKLERNTIPHSKRRTGAQQVPPEWSDAERRAEEGGKPFVRAHNGGSRRTKRRPKRTRKKKSRRNMKSRRR